MAERFARGGRLLAIGVSPTARSDVRHVAVEFVHPVIVGKRALPALGLVGDSAPLATEVRLAAGADDIVMAFGDDPDLSVAIAAARAVGAITVAFAPLHADWELVAPVGDPFIAQELVETAYHVLWELVHVFFEHRGLLQGRTERRAHDAGAASFLYPFLADQEHDLDAVLGDIAGSAMLKAREVCELREATLAAGGDGALAAAAATLRGALDDGGRLMALGNGGSATDSMDVVADFAMPPAGGAWPARPALDLTADAAILTAIANDIGVEAIFARQIIAHGRAGDVLLVLSTSGSSASAIDALLQARRQGLHSIALVGYDGGQIGSERACRPRDRRALAAHPAHPGGPGDRLPPAAGARRAVTAAARRVRARARVTGTVQGVGFRPFVYRLAHEQGLAGWVRNDEHGVLLEVEGPSDELSHFFDRLSADAPPLARVERVERQPVPVEWGAGEPGFRIVASAAGGDPDALIAADAATCDDCLAELGDPGDRRYRYPFINCTNCGPRFTIVRGVPYDRPLTTMAPFTMCSDCAREYEDPSDRRFHAQPNACPACGPQVRLWDADGGSLANSFGGVERIRQACVLIRSRPWLRG